MRTRTLTTLFAVIFGISIFAQPQPGLGGQGPHVQVGPKIPSGPFVPPSVNNDPGGNWENPPQDDPRLVFWMHGLGGDKNAWADAAFASEHGAGGQFPARKLRSITDTEYDEDLTAMDAAFFADQKLSQYVALGGEPDQNFVVAHSQGGIVTRAMAYLDHCFAGASEPNFGGFVTFGTPNQGAMILNNASMFDELIGDLCTELTVGPEKELLNNLSRIEFKIIGIEAKIDFKLDEAIGDMASRVFCGILEDNFAPLLRANQVPPICDDYRVGAPFLKEMNDCESQEFLELPKMAFYGVEPVEALLPRTMQWLMVNPNTEDFFEANDDGTLIAMWNENFFRYADRVAHWQDRYDRAALAYDNNKCYTALRYYWQKCIRFRTRKKENLAMVQAWQRGVDFLNSMDDRYKLVIGALEINRTKKEECWTQEEIVSRGGGPSQYGPWVFSHVMGPGAPLCGPKNPWDMNNYEVRTKILIERKELPSDGVVLASSASDLPGATWVPQLCENSSHMQMRNDRNTERHLNKLYGGEYHPFFETDKL